MKEKLLHIWKKLEPVHGVIYFVVILLCCHFFWKYTVIGDESDQQVTFFGLNISVPFVAMTNNLTNVVAYFLRNWLNVSFIVHENIIHFSNHIAVAIVWACSGLKQMYIYFCIIAFYKGPWKHKLWYIPMGLLIAYLFNIFRITFISYMAYTNIHTVDFLHNHLFKYLFYGIIFLLWVIWEEKFAKKKQQEEVS